MPGLVERQAVVPAIPQIWQASLDESAVSVDWSASGGWFAAVSASGTVCVFDAANGVCVRQLPAHRFGATRIAWHPQDARFATAGQDGFVRSAICSCPARVSASYFALRPYSLTAQLARI
jgi:WD40 repeat protein